jgi:hypothetical protein
MAPAQWPARTGRRRRLTLGMAGLAAAVALAIAWRVAGRGAASPIAVPEKATAEAHNPAVPEAVRVPGPLAWTPAPSESISPPHDSPARAGSPAPAGDGVPAEPTTRPRVSANAGFPVEATPRPPAVASSAAPSSHSSAPLPQASPSPHDLVLNAISEQDGHPVALINDRLVREGDEFDGVKILHIGETEVEVEHGGQRRVIRF